MNAIADIAHRAVDRVLGQRASDPQNSAIAKGLFGGEIGPVPRRGTYELLRAYSELPWLRAISHKIASEVASTTWVLFAGGRTTQAGRREFYRDRVAQRSFGNARRRRLSTMKQRNELVEIEDHPLLDLLDDGNPALPGVSSVQIIQTHYDIVGEFFMMKERDGLGGPDSLWPLPPHWITNKILPGAQDFFRINHRAFQKEVPRDDMVYGVDPDPSMPYGRGTGVARALNDELATDENAAKYTNAFFNNNARPDYIATLKNAGEEQAKEFSRLLNERHRGVFRAFRALVTSQELTLEKLGFNMRELQFEALRKLERDICIQVWGMPPELLGIIENSNRATIQSAEFLMAKHVLVPRLEFLRAVIQQQLVWEFDDRLIVDYVSPVDEDREFTLKVMEAAPYSFRLDEWRELADHDELDDGLGDVFALPFNLIFADAPSDLSSGGSDDPPAEEPPPEGEAGLLRSISTRVEKIDSDDADRIANAVDGEKMEQAVRTSAREALRHFGQGEIDGAGLDISFDMGSPEVVDFIENRAAQHIRGSVTPTTRRAIREALREGIDAGESIRDLAKRVRDVFTDATARRSVVIARTETIRASNFGRVAGMQQAGFSQKEWLATGGTGSGDESEPVGPNVRDTHAALNGQRVGLAQAFTSINGTANYPGGFGVAAEDINCRCTVIAVTDADGFDEQAAQSAWRQAVWRAFERDRRPYERRLRLRVNQELRRQERAVLTALSRSEGA